LCYNALVDIATDQVGRQRAGRSPALADHRPYPVV